LVGTLSPDELRGTPGADVIVGRAGFDKIIAGGGPDLICARGADVVDGGDDFDRVGYERAERGVKVNLCRGDWLDGGRGRDKMRFTRRSGVAVDLGTGQVQSPVGARVWSFKVIVGTPGGDRIHGSRRAERIVVRGASDALYGRGRADALWGGAGNDLVRGGGGRDRACGGGGVDICTVERRRGCEL
jgi:Ca2+-binding RTX toxin-like protein